MYLEFLVVTFAQSLLLVAEVCLHSRVWYPDRHIDIYQRKSSLGDREYRLTPQDLVKQPLYSSFLEILGAD